MDVTLRLEPLAQELERTREPVLIVGHQGILRILYAYFMDWTVRRLRMYRFHSTM
jgi:broad specificity phosphatase PhoE